MPTCRKPTCLTLGLALLLAGAGSCRKAPSAPDSGPAATKQAVRPEFKRLARLPEKAMEIIPEHGPYRFYDRERRPAVRHVAWLLLKATNLPSVSLEKVNLELVGSLKGLSLGHLERFFKSVGLDPVVVAESLGDFIRRDRPGVLALKPRNPALPDWACTLVVYRGVAPDGKLRITDPLTGAREVDQTTLATRFLGAALYLEQDRVGPLFHAPDIGADEILHDYGRVDAGTLVRKTFRIFNRGDQDLKIFQVRPSCGCLATPLHDRGARVADPHATFKRNPKTGVWEIDFAKMKRTTVVAPGGEVYVTGFYDTTNRVGHQPTSFTVISNDPDERELRFLVVGFVTQVAQFDPPVLCWRSLASAEEAVGHVWVRSMKGRPFTIHRIHLSDDRTRRHIEVTEDPGASRAPPAPATLPDGFKAQAHPAEAGWKALRIRVKPGLPVGPFNTVVSLETELSPSPLAFGVWGRITGNIVVEPSVATFGRVPLGVQRFARVRVHSRSKQPFRITRAEVDRSRIMELTLTEETPGVYCIELKLKKGWQAPSLAGQIRIETNDPLEPTRRIEVTGFVRRR